MTIVMSDPRLAKLPVRELGEPMVPVLLGAPGVLVREGVALRLGYAASLLPGGVRLHVVEGYRPLARQRRIIERYRAQVLAANGPLAAADLEELTSRYVAPLTVAPHLTGSAVDLTLADPSGRPLDLGCPLDATPEESRGTCFFASADIAPQARELRELLAGALSTAGFVNYPTEWWHWSYGDRYWALLTGHEHAHYGPIADGCAA